MRGGLRLAVAVWTAGLLLGPAPLVAQSTPPATTNTPAADAIGPKELQNFSLSGTVVRPADPPAGVKRTTPAPAPASRASAEPRTTNGPAEAHTETPMRASQTESAEQVRSRNEVASSGATPAVDRASESERPPLPSSSITAALPPPRPAPASVSPGFATQPESDGTLAPEHGFSLLPWLLAAVALGGGGAFLFWRNRSREAFAGGPQLDAFSAPEPPPAQPPQTRAPRPEPAPAPPPPSAAPPLSGGIVSTRLRPWVEIGMHPLRCIVEDTRVTFEFELELFNSGNAPARAVLVEASVFNAGPTQDQEIGSFFAKPVGEGERIAEIPPLQRMTLRTQVVAPRENVQVFEIAERQVFVPLIAFNALYRWGRSEGQSSVSYLLGRDTKGEKMAPFRLDLGPRVFRGVGARPLPQLVRN